MTNELLTHVLDAHGGRLRWASVIRLTAQMSLGGWFWAARGWPDVYADQTVVIDPHRQHISFSPFTALGRTSVFDAAPEVMTLREADGTRLEERLDPRSSFPTEFNVFDTQWDAIQVAYFTSCAVWNYLVAPFVFTYSGVEVRELEPWLEDGETWRRLAVRFPSGNANHNADQVFYYDEHFMHRRMDYAPEVTGKTPIGQYAYDHKTFQGFVFPTRREVRLREPDGLVDLSVPPAITVEIDSISVETESDDPPATG